MGRRGWCEVEGPEHYERVTFEELLRRCGKEGSKEGRVWRLERLRELPRRVLALCLRGSRTDHRTSRLAELVVVRERSAESCRKVVDGDD